MSSDQQITEPGGDMPDTEKRLPCPNFKCRHGTAALICVVVQGKWATSAYIRCEGCEVRGPIGQGETSSLAARVATRAWNEGFLRPVDGSILVKCDGQLCIATMVSDINQLPGRLINDTKTLL